MCIPSRFLELQRPHSHTIPPVTSLDQLLEGGCSSSGVTCSGSDIVEISVSGQCARMAIESSLWLLCAAPASSTPLAFCLPLLSDRFALVSAALSGTIPTQLSLLSSLRVLYLPSNSVSGTLPTELGETKQPPTLTMHETQARGCH